MASFMRHARSFGMEPRLRVMPSLEAVETVGQVDMVFLDADHSYESIAAEIMAWGKKAKRVLAGHDYGHPKFPVVKRAVDERFPHATIVDSVWSVGCARG